MIVTFFCIQGTAARLSARLKTISTFATVVLCLSAAMSTQTTGGANTFQLSSPVFAEGQTIAKKFTCDGPDVSPPMSLEGVPAAAKSLALIADDPDAPAGTWVHWVIFNIPASMKELPEGVEKTEQVAGGAMQGRNSFPRIGYDGPCPPPGKPHRYFFKLYALDGILGLKPGATKADVERAMKGHILAEAQIVGRYGR